MPYIVYKGMPTITMADGYKSGYECEDEGSRSGPEEGHEREGRAKLYICQAYISGVKRSSNMLKSSAGLGCARYPKAPVYPLLPSSCVAERILDRFTLRIWNSNSSRSLRLADVQVTEP